MYGQNKRRPQNRATGEWLEVKEIFHTIQGEGTFAGHPAIFIRLSGCNLACYYCDTDFSKGAKMTLLEIEDALKESVGPGHVKPNLVVITGGEPFRQNILPLIERLALSLAFSVQIETAGTLMLPGLKELRERIARSEKGTTLTIVCSPKTPKLHPELIPFIDAYKYITEAGLANTSEGLPTLSSQVEGEFIEPFSPPLTAPIYLQAMDTGDPRDTQSNMMAVARRCIKYGYLLSTQVHKLAGLR